MRANLGPGERLLPGAAEAAARALEDPRVEAVLLPLVPEGAGAFPTLARRYLAAWDARFVHPQTFFAPAARAVTREPVPGWRSAEAAPRLARAIDEGRRVEALPGFGVASPFADDLDALLRWAREEGALWGRLAAREARFAPFLPVLDRAGWWRHNVVQVQRRVLEASEAVKRPDAPLVLLHLAREAAFTGGCVAGHAAAKAQPS